MNNLDVVITDLALVELDYQQYILDCARHRVEPVPFELWDREAWLRRDLSTFTDVSALQAD